MKFKRTTKFLSFSLSLINIFQNYNIFASSKPKLSQNSFVCYSDISEKDLDQMKNYFTYDNPEFKDSDGIIVPLTHPIEISVRDGRKIKVLLANAPALFGYAGKFIRKTGVSFEEMLSGNTNVVHALINIALDEQLEFHNAKLTGSKNIRKISENQDELKKRIGVFAQNIKNLVQSNEYKPIVNEIGEFLRKSGNDDIDVDMTKNIIVTKIAGKELELIKESDELKKLEPGVIDDVVDLVAVGLDVAETAVGLGGTFVVSAIFTWFLAEVFTGGLINIPFSLVVAGGGIGSLLTVGSSDNLFRFSKGRACSKEYDELEAKKRDEKMILEIKDIVTQQKIANYGNLLSSFFDGLINNPRNLSNANVCVFMIDDRGQIDKEIMDNGRNKYKTTPFDVFSKYPNMGSYCGFKRFRNSPEDILPCFGNYTDREGNNIYVFYIQVLNRLSRCIDSGDYEEMNNMNNILKGKPSPKRLLTHTEKEEEEK